MRAWLAIGCLMFSLWLSTSHARAEATLQPGETIDFEHIDRLRPVLPSQLWQHRKLYFDEAMRLEVTPPGDYSPPAIYREAALREGHAPVLEPDGRLEDSLGGQPFPVEGIDCKSDPKAGLKLAWNHNRRLDRCW